MYADEKTDSVMNAYNTTVKRRKLQMKYNEVHGITPTSAQRTLKEKLSQEDEKVLILVKCQKMSFVYSLKILKKT